MQFLLIPGDLQKDGMFYDFLEYINCKIVEMNLIEIITFRNSSISYLIYHQMFFFNFNQLMALV